MVPKGARGTDEKFAPWWRTWPRSSGASRGKWPQGLHRQGRQAEVEAMVEKGARGTEEELRAVAACLATQFG